MIEPNPAATLAEVLERENAALAALDLQRAGALLAEKDKAVRALADAAEPAPPDAARLRALVQANRRLLEHAIAVQGRVIAVVASALPHPAAAGRYAASGAAVQGRGAVPFALLARA